MYNSSFLNKIDKDWTLFLDRDGVINKRIFGGYVKNIDEFEFLPGVLDSLKELRTKFRRIIVITNQQGIGKGIMTVNDLDKVHDHMLEIVNNNGGRIDKVFYCPDLVSEEKNCRKPNSIMAINAQKEFPEIDLNKSIMIGDSMSDIEFGINSGMKTVYVTSSEANKKASELSDMSLYDLKEFTLQIMKYEA